MIEDEILTEEPSVEEPSASSVEVETTTTQEEGLTVNVTIQQPEASPASVEEDPADSEEMAAEVLSVDAAYTVTSPTVLENTESDTADPVMVDVITSVLGEYRRQTYTVEQYDSNGDLIATSTEYVPGLAGLDYAWIAGAILFSLVLAAGFKLLGGLIRS